MVKNFNKMTERQMEQTNGGAIIFFVMFLSMLATCTVAGVLGGAAAGTASRK